MVVARLLKAKIFLIKVLFGKALFFKVVVITTTLWEPQMLQKRTKPTK